MSPFRTTTSISPLSNIAMHLPNFRPTYVLFFALAWCCLLQNTSHAQKCLAPDFKVELLYGVPDIEHPSVLACDDEGNLFVGEDPMDMRGPATKEFDRVLRIEFDADGKPKRKTVFCENLGAVFGLIWRDGALYVMHAPHYSVFRDTNGDGVADERKDLATGFGPPAGIYGFNDHIVTGTRLGLDDRVYVSVGDKGVPKAVGSDGSIITLEGGGVIRMKLDGSKLEVVTSGTRNHLDVAMDSLDNIFTYDNTDDGLGWWTRFTRHVPTGYYGYPYDYHPHPERHLPRVSEHGGGSPVGAACYREAAWPATYVDSPFFCEWGKQKVQRFKLKPNGASFEAELEDFLVPDGPEPFRPLDICFSPDGRHMYLADWNFNGWVNPAVKGRLYRITYVGNDPAVKDEPKRAPQNASVDEWAKSLGHPSHAERMRAQHELAKRSDGQGVAAAIAVLRDGKADEHAHVHAAWVLHAAMQTGTKPESLKALRDAITKTGSPRVRAQLARVLGMLRDRESIPALTQLLQADSDATVRLQSAIAIGAIGEAPSQAKWRSVDSGQAGVIVPRQDDKTLETLSAGNQEAARAILPGLIDSDPYVAHVAMQALRRVNVWSDLPQQAAAHTDAKSVAAKLILAMTGVYDERAIHVLRSYATDAKLPELQSQAVAALAEVDRRAAPYEKGWWGTQPARGQPVRVKNQDWSGTSTVLESLRKVMESSSSPAAKIEVAKAWRRIADPAAAPLLRKLAANSDQAELASEAMTTLAAIKDPESLPLFASIATDEKRPEAVRREAVRGIMAVGSPDAVRHLVDIVSAKNSSPLLLTASMEALGSLKRAEARPAIDARLRDDRAEVRARAVETLGLIGGDGLTGRVVPLLKDQDANVRKAVLNVLRTLKDRDTIPSVLAVASDAAVKFEAQQTLAAMPDRRALAAYLDGAASPNPDLRNASIQAITAIRDAIAEDILALHKGQELPASAVPPLRTVFSTPSPIKKWKLIGGFSKANAAQLPKWDFTKAPDFSQKQQVGERNLEWKEIASPDANGRVSPAQHLPGPHEQAWCYAYAPIEASAPGPRNIIVGSDDQLRVWVNGKQVYEFGSSRGWDKEQGRVTAEFQAGVNHIWIQCGNDGGPWDYSLAVNEPDARFAFLFENAAPQLDINAFREFAAKNAGDADRGKKIFDNPQGVGCVKCHAVGGTGGKVGPDLVGIGARYPREELVRSILEPSSRIANGFDTGVVSTADGKVITGVLKLDSPEAVELMLADGKLVRIAAADIDEKSRSPVSTMPNGLKDGLTLQDFADIVAYLEKLK